MQDSQKNSTKLRGIQIIFLFDERHFDENFHCSITWPVVASLEGLEGWELPPVLLSRATEGKSQAGVGEAKGDDACSSGSGTASGCLSAIHLKNITCKLIFNYFSCWWLQHSTVPPFLIHCRKTENISASYSLATNVHSRCRVNFHRTKRGCHVYTITVSCKWPVDGWAQF